ncbi:MAG: D-sedoheptulose 7-phosphate isomerase [Acidobacteria bacterium]|nr:D-sedoheptulose 7-phosphate isomerase [Acidobacteriota bacterium]
MRVPDAAPLVREILADTIRAHEQAATDVTSIVRAADVMASALKNGRKVLAFGNGGSASDAQHLAAELVGRFVRERRALAGLALSTDTSVLTSIANDYSFDRVFSRQIEALGVSGDVAVAISTSGSSPNVLDACRVARERGLSVIAMTGRDGGELGRLADVHLNVPHASTARVQEVHRTLLHVMCELVEREIV